MRGVLPRGRSLGDVRVRIVGFSTGTLCAVEMSGHRVEFTDSENPWAPTAVVAEINARNGCGLEVVGLAEQTGGLERVRTHSYQ